MSTGWTHPRLGRIRRLVLPALYIAATSMAGLGLITSALLKTDGAADKLLAWNPRYSLAERGLHTLETFKYPLQTAPNAIEQVGVLAITDPSWDVIRDFMKSETAIRKSERNLPSYSPEAPVGTPPDTKPMAPPQHSTEINFDRVKTVIALRVDLARAGDQPLAPPYRLIVVTPPWRPGDFRTPYEFLSFAEFRLDLRHMILDEMEEWTLWLAVVSFGFGLLLEALRRIVSFAERKPPNVSSCAASSSSPSLPKAPNKDINQEVPAPANS